MAIFLSAFILYRFEMVNSFRALFSFNGPCPCRLYRDYGLFDPTQLQFLSLMYRSVLFTDPWEFFTFWWTAAAAPASTTTTTTTMTMTMTNKSNHTYSYQTPFAQIGCQSKLRTSGDVPARLWVFVAMSHCRSHRYRWYRFNIICLVCIGKHHQLNG